MFHNLRQFNLSIHISDPKIVSLQHKGMIVPHDRLSQTALQGLIEEFVTREGTDTGYTDGSLVKNVEMIIRQLNRGDVVIVYDEDTRTANIVPKETAKSFPQEKA
jgi:uncharacterized protein